MVQRWNVCAIVFWRVVWYRAGTFLLCDHGRARRGHVVAVTVACPSWPSVMPWLCPSCRGVPGCGRGMPWPWRPPSLCRRRVVATRRWMLVFAMVLAVSVLSQFALRLQGVYSESHQANDNEEKGKIQQRIRRPGRQPGSPEESAAWMIDN